MNILMTGATGFVGRELVRQLKADPRRQLFGVVRTQEAGERLADMGVEPIRCDLVDGPGLREALGEKRFVSVIHLAAEIASQRSKRKLRAVNLQGTRNLFHAVKDNPGLERFIFVSTVVVGDANGGTLVEWKPLRVETEYGRTKQSSERLLLQAAEEEHFPAIVVRPCHIYGNGGWFKEILTRIKRGFMRLPGDGENYWDVVHVEDVASALLCVLDRGQPGEIYHVADDTPVTMKDFLNEAATGLGRKKKLGHAPIFLANLLYGRDTIKSIVRSARTSNRKLKTLGWEPRYPDYKAGLRRTLEDLG